MRAAVERNDVLACAAIERHGGRYSRPAAVTESSAGMAPRRRS
jgi:hypothetical protein